MQIEEPAWKYYVVVCGSSDVSFQEHQKHMLRFESFSVHLRHNAQKNL